MQPKIFVLFLGLLWGPRLPVTSSQDATNILLVCFINGFYPSNIVATWLKDGQPIVSSSFNELPRMDYNGNTSGFITARSIYREEERQEATYTCRLSDEASQTNVRIKFKDSGGKRKGLHKNFYCANDQQTSLQQASSILTGIVIGLKTSEVSVQWMKNALVEGHHSNTQVLKGSSKDSLLAYSQVVVPYSDWKNGTSYSCMFTHKAGSMEPTQRPEEKFQGAK